MELVERLLKFWRVIMSLPLLILSIVAVLISKQESQRWNNECFGFFLYVESLFDCYAFCFIMNSFRKVCSVKCIVLLCNHYHFCGNFKIKNFSFFIPFFFFCWSSWVTAYIIVFSHFISKRHSKGGPISEIVHTGTWNVYWIVFLIWYWCSFFLFKLIELRAYGSIYMSTDSSI